MNIFTSRHGPSQNIAFLGLMCALIAILSSLAAYVPFSAIFVILFVPLISALTVELIEKRYIPLFIVASMGLAIATAPTNFQDILFYVWPAILSGSLYGFLSILGVPLCITVFASSLLSMGLNYLALPIIQGLYGVDMLTTALTILQLQNKEGITIIVPLFLFSYSLAQVGLSHILIEGVGERIVPQRKDDTNVAFIYPLLGLVFGVLSLSLPWLSPSVSYLFLGMSFFFALFGALAFFPSAHHSLYVLLVLLLVGSIFLMAFLYHSYPSHCGLLLLSFFSIAFTIYELIASLLLKKERKTPIVK